MYPVFQHDQKAIIVIPGGNGGGNGGGGNGGGTTEIPEVDVPLVELPDVDVPLTESPQEDVVAGTEDVEEPMVLDAEDELIAVTGDNNHMKAGFGGMFAALAGMFMLRKKKEN